MLLDRLVNCLMLLNRLVNCLNAVGQTGKLFECWADRCAGLNKVTQMDVTQMKRSVVAEGCVFQEW